MKEDFVLFWNTEHILDRDLNQLKESFLWSGYPNFIIEKFFKVAIKQKTKQFQNSGLDVPKKTKYILVFSILMNLR